MDARFRPRSSQKDIASYRGGTMGVSAVPGSGKTWTLSYLAAELIKNKFLSDDQEVLVVTLVNSAVQNFSQRIGSFLKAYGLVPSLGYRVRTLHGLAHDIVKERPELAGLDNGFQIIDEREAIRIREDAVHAWLRDNPRVFDPYLISDLSEKKINDLYSKGIPELLNQIAFQFIRSAKNLQLSPPIIKTLLASHLPPHPLIEFGNEVYATYQRNLSFRGAVDFDDLISKAFQILSLDKYLLERLQAKWPFILEDEAQDSSLLQQNILDLLSSQVSRQNWVRVGDPNQAIYESFTTADPRLLNAFIQNSSQSHTLPNSGRNSEDIIGLANHLVRWCNTSHPNTQVRDALYPNMIVPAPPGDPQPNPPSHPDAIHLYAKSLTPDEEIKLVASSISKWLPAHPNSTVAVLAPRNERGKKMVSVLRNNYQIEPVELLNSSLATRKTVGALVKVISYLIDPISSKKLSETYKVFQRTHKSDPDAWGAIEDVAELLGSLSKPELFLNPASGTDWLESLPDTYKDHKVSLVDFRNLVLKWHQAALLPIDQLILTISADIFTEATELSLAHQLASFERQLYNSHPDWEMPALLDELRSLARNERRFAGAREDIQFNPEDHKGKIVVTTAHKAKGLEWDRVYLISANNYNFPSGAPNDQYISEKWFIRDSLNLPAETLALLDFLHAPENNLPMEGDASKLARLEYIRERLRLLYVSITRAKKELIITWNTGRKGTSQPALAFEILADYLENSKKKAT